MKLLFIAALVFSSSVYADSNAIGSNKPAQGTQDGVSQVAPTPSTASPAAPTQPCFENEFTKICVAYIAESRFGTPALSYTIQNLTDEPLLIAPNKAGFSVPNDPSGSKSISMTDEAGNSCPGTFTGINSTSDYAMSSDGDFNRVVPGKTINMHAAWLCKPGPVGKTMDNIIYMVRYKTGDRSVGKFLATIPDIYIGK